MFIGNKSCNSLPFTLSVSNLYPQHDSNIYSSLYWWNIQNFCFFHNFWHICKLVGLSWILSTQYIYGGPFLISYWFVLFTFQIIAPDVKTDLSKQRYKFFTTLKSSKYLVFRHINDQARLASDTILSICFSKFNLLSKNYPKISDRFHFS